MAKLKANEVLENAVNGETPMSVDNELTQLERDTIAAKAHAAATKATVEGLHLKVRQSTMAVEEAITARRALSARIAEGEDITDDELSAAYLKIAAAKERVTTFQEALPAARAAYTLAERALLGPLVAELRLRLGVAFRWRVHLQELTAINDARFSALEKAGQYPELHYVELALAQFPPIPEPPSVLAVAAE